MTRGRVPTGRDSSPGQIVSYMFFVYVIISLKTSRLYVGQTSDLQRRLIQHNSGEVKSTKSFIPWKLVYYEEFSSRAEAMRREKYLKSLKNKNYLLKIIDAG